MNGLEASTPPFQEPSKALVLHVTRNLILVVGGDAGLQLASDGVSMTGFWGAPWPIRMH